MKNLLVLLLLYVSTPLSAESLLMAAVAGYKRPITALVTDFEQRSGHKVDQLYGNMVQVLAQSSHSDQVAVVVGDAALLQQAKEVSFHRFIPLGQGRLVLAFAKGKSLTSPEQLRDPDFARIALADSKRTIYGKAAQQFLASSGLGPQIQTKLLMIGSVPQISSYLVSGEADAGFINFSDALALKQMIGGFIEINPHFYQPIKIAAGVVQGHELDTRVLAFERYLVSADAQKIITGYGL